VASAEQSPPHQHIKTELLKFSILYSTTKNGLPIAHGDYRSLLFSTIHMRVYPKVSGLSGTKYTLTIINTRWEAIQRYMAAKLTRLTHKIMIQLNLVAGSCTVCSSPSGRPVLKLLDTPSYRGIIVCSGTTRTLALVWGKLW